MKLVLRQERENSGKTQAEIAKLAGVSLRAYLRYESGERMPPLDVACRIADVLGKDVRELFKEIEG